MAKQTKAKRFRKSEPRKLPEFITFDADSKGRRRMLIDSLPVRNGVKPLVVEVERADISGANPKDPRNCALARAVRREYAGGDAVVYRDRFFLRPAGASHWERFKLSLGMKLETNVFDRGGRVSTGPLVATPLSPHERARYEAGGRQGSAAPGARDRGSRDRTPKVTRPAPYYAPDVRHWTAGPAEKGKRR